MPRDQSLRGVFAKSGLAGVLVAAVASGACVAPTELAEGPPDTNVGSIASAATARTCSAAELAKILGPGNGAVNVTCSAKLPPGSTVTRELRFQGDAADDVVLDCAGGTIDGNIRIESTFAVAGEEGFVPARDLAGRTPKKNADGFYVRQRPENVTLTHCKIHGSTRIAGLGDNGQAPLVTASSHQHLVAPGHPARARDAAPTNVVLDDMDIDISGGKAVYAGPGVTRFTLRGSRVSGHSDTVVVYLDAESRQNTLRNNVFKAKTNREIVAIDGSSSNLIVDNAFYSTDDGGIYLYRNCGEGGAVRVSTPSENQILNNFFYYDQYEGREPAVWLSSRDAQSYNRYCNDDSAYDYGSGKYDWDYARYNVVMQNQIRGRTVADMIQTQHATINSPNYVARNEQVSARITRKSGCYLPSGYATDFVLDGVRTRVVDATSDGAACVWKTCDDGVLRNDGTCVMKAVSFECAARDTNAGCTTTAQCPASTSVLGVTAVCDLEHGTLGASELAAVKPGRVDVATLSDETNDGRCWVDGTTVQSREDRVVGESGRRGITAGCKEHDENGGDCALEGTIYCVDLPQRDVPQLSPERMGARGSHWITSPRSPRSQ